MTPERRSDRPARPEEPRSGGGLRGALSGVVVVVVVLGAWALWLQRTQPERGGAGAEEPQFPATVTERPAHPPAVTALSAPHAGQAAAAAAPADPDERAAPGSAPRADNNQAAQSARFDRAAAEFAAQPYDGAWAPQTEADVRHALEPRLAGVTLAGKLAPVACRSRWCAIDIEAPSPADLTALDTAVHQLSADLSERHGPVPSARVSDPAPDGSPRRARYFLRFRRE